jgi:hypothetical protein
VCVGLLAFATVAQANAEGRSGNTVATDKGVVTGLEKGGVRQFLGIPYALAPVGRMRWMPPEPAEARSGPRVCSSPLSIVVISLTPAAPSLTLQLWAESADPAAILQHYRSGRAKLQH